MKLTRAIFTLSTLSLLAACGPAETQTLDTDDLAGLSLTHAQGAAIVYVVNHPTTTLEVLDEAVGLDKRAAVGIIERRAGADGFLGTADDQPFETVSDIDAVQFVGPAALGRLEAFAIGEKPWTEYTDDTTFTALEAAVTVFGVNQADMEELDHSVPLNARAARNLIDNAPYFTIAEMAAVPYVGPATLASLRDYGVNWRAKLDGGEAPLAGTFDGIEFNESVARFALDISNYASGSELKEWGGLWTSAANLLLENRPFADLDEIADTAGIGAGTMEALRNFGASGVWPHGPCGASFAAANLIEVADYSEGIGAFDPGEAYTHWQLSAWEIPSCVNLSDASTRESLRAHALQVADWTSIDDEYPEMLITTDLTYGSSHFESELAKSLSYLADVRDDYVSNGETWAEAAYDELAAENAAVNELVTRNPSNVFEFSITVDAVECSEYQSIAVDLEAGVLFEIRKGPSC